MKHLPLVIIIGIALLVCACVRRPKDVLSNKEMASLVADLKLAEAYLQTRSAVSKKDDRETVVEYIIARHGLTRAQFDTTMAWYARNTDAYYEMCDLAEKELLIKKKKLAGGGSLNVEIESSDLWPYQRQSYLTKLSGSDVMEFSIPASEIAKGDRLNFKFRINNPVTLDALFGIEYEDGENSYISRSINQSKRLDLTLQTDTGKTVKRIFGNFRVSDSGYLPLWLDSIYLYKLPYDSAEYYRRDMQRIYRQP